MSRRGRNILFRGQTSLILWAVLLLLVAGCAAPTPTSTPGPVTPVTQVKADLALQEAQKLFDEASRLVQAGQPVSAEARAKYQKVIDQVEREVLGQVRDDLAVTAYALEAFSRWQLRNYAGAIKAAEKGRQLYEKSKLTTNRRDYGMLLMTGGLVLYTQTYQAYQQTAGAALSREQVQGVVNRLASSLQEIDRVNSLLRDRREPIVIYANQWQLMIIKSIMRIWSTDVPEEAVWKPEVKKWLGRADQILAKLPEGDYPNKSLTLKLKEDFQSLAKIVK